MPVERPPVAPFVGALVVARNPRETVLACGSHVYTEAVCVSLCPFVLVSLNTDMLWGHHRIGEFRAVGAAHTSTLSKCIRRLVRDIRIGQRTRPRGAEINSMFKG